MQKFSSGSLIHVAEGTLKATKKYPNRERGLVPRQEKKTKTPTEGERKNFLSPSAGETKGLFNTVET